MMTHEEVWIDRNDELRVLLVGYTNARALREHRKYQKESGWVYLGRL